MKILVLADEESKYLWDYFEKSKLEDIDLIISCGDLKPQYLSFLATFCKGPVLYVHGNHDGCYMETPPEGCICIEDKVYVHNGIRIMGLGGSMQYNGNGFQYTEREMRFRAFKMLWKILIHRGVDIMVTHAPAYHFNDGDDQPHMGFKVFCTLLDRLKPKYFLHGHVHLTYNWNQQRECTYNDHTTVINGYERYVFEYK